MQTKEVLSFLDSFGGIIKTNLWISAPIILSLYLLILWLGYKRRYNAYRYHVSPITIIGVVTIFVIGGISLFFTFAFFMESKNIYESEMEKNIYYNQNIDKEYVLPGDKVKYFLFKGYASNLAWEPEHLVVSNNGNYETLRWWDGNIRFESHHDTPMEVIQIPTNRKLYEYDKKHPTFAYFKLTHDKRLVGETLKFNFYSRGSLRGTGSIKVTSLKLIEEARQVALQKANEKSSTYENYAMLALVLAGLAGTILLSIEIRSEEW